MSDTVYLNGQFVPADRAQISVWDGGWLHGAGLFETMRAHRGHIFRLQAHLHRLIASAEKLLFPLQPSDLPSLAQFDELLGVNQMPNARVRLTVSAGPAADVPPDDDSDARPSLTVCVTSTPFVPYPDTLRSQGMPVCISTYKTSPNDPIAGHKCTGFLPRLLALRQAHARQCNEALWFTTDNLLAEGCVSNVFLVKDNVLLTPPLETPVLPGVTRAVVLELADTKDMPVEQKPLTIDALLDADEIFLTNAIMEIMPVCRVEKKEIGPGKPGPITQQMLADYRALLAKECPADG